MSSPFQQFRDTFGEAPTLVVRAPGRVNLIGDHTDYNGLPVLPIACERVVTILLRQREDDLVRLGNVDPEFPTGEFRLGCDIPRQGRGHWLNYVQAAAQAMVREYGARCGFDAIVHGDIPVAAGLSSSAALVVASGLALMKVNGIEVDPLPLMDLMAQAERYVGTEGGGMDQAICLGGQPGAALYIEFEPLRLKAVAVPPSWRFLVASSLIRAEKSGEVQAAYNERHAQCREALSRLRVAWRNETPPLGGLTTYAEIFESRATDQALTSANALLPAQLFRRFRHTLSEAQRVRAAVAALQRARIGDFGALMSASHASLRDDYDVSVSALDQLVEVAVDAGAVGARLTGAGFGGCIVALGDVSVIDAVQDALVQRFYATRGVTTGLDDLVFVAHPSAGASVAGV